MKKRFAVLAATVLLLSSIPVFASELGAINGNSVLEMYIDSYAAYINGEYRQIDDNVQVTPVIVDDRTLVPARFVGEVFGCEVLWNDETREVTMHNDKNTIKAVLDEQTIDVNGKKTAIDVPAQTLNDRTVLPLRAIAEALGKTVEYDNGLIAIGDKAAVETYMKGNIEDIIRDKFKCNMRLKKELKKRSSEVFEARVQEYNGYVLVSRYPASNGGFHWLPGNVPHKYLPIEEGDYRIYEYAIYNNHIYYNYGPQGSEYSWPNSIYCCDMDGKNATLLTDDAACESGLVIINGKLYYSSYSDNNDEWAINVYGAGDGNINVIDLKTGQKSKVIDGISSNPESKKGVYLSRVYDDIIIYSVNSKLGYAYNYYCWFNIITGESGRLNKDELPKYVWSNSECNVFFYNSDSNKEIRVLYNNTGEDYVIAQSNNNIGIVNVTDQYIYYIENSNSNGNNYKQVYRIQRPDV